MNENEIRVLRTNIVFGMDTYVREVIGDESITEYWLTYGMPDGSDVDAVMYDMEDEETFEEWCRVFAKCVKANVEND